MGPKRHKPKIIHHPKMKLRASLPKIPMDGNVHMIEGMAFVNRLPEVWDERTKKFRKMRKSEVKKLLSK